MKAYTPYQLVFRFNIIYSSSFIHEYVFQGYFLVY